MKLIRKIPINLDVKFLMELYLEIESHLKITFDWCGSPIS